MARKIALRDRAGDVIGHAVVDDADGHLAARRWCGHWRNGKLYVQRGWRRPDGSWTTVALHREVMGLAPRDPGHVDHIDGDPLNNQRSNLRVVTHKHNTQNRSAAGNRGSTSRFRGVSWHRQHAKWQAQARVDGRTHHLGYFTEEEAAAAAASRFRLERMPGAVS